MSVSVRVMRPCMYVGQRREPGEVLTVAPLVAYDLTSSGRCALVEPGQAEEVHRAVVAHNSTVARPPRPGSSTWR